jgi:hypothetical protein
MAVSVKITGSEVFQTSRSNTVYCYISFCLEIIGLSAIILYYVTFVACESVQNLF